jgi:protein-export membrane protein SecD
LQRDFSFLLCYDQVDVECLPFLVHSDASFKTNDATTSYKENFMVYLSSFKIRLFVLFSIIGIFLTAPSFLPHSVLRYWPSWLPQKQLVLGLDLKGGVNLLLEVEKEGLVKERIASTAPAVRRFLREQKIRYKSFKITKDLISFQLVDPSQSTVAQEALEKNYQEQGFSTQHESAEPSQLFLRLKPEAIEVLMKQAVQKSIEVIDQRINETGAVEPVILPQGMERITLQIPGFEDPSKVRDLLGKTAKLSFQWVEDQPGPNTVQMPLIDRDIEKTDKSSARTSSAAPLLHIQNEVLISGEDVIHARADYGADKGSPVVAFSLSAQGAKVFSHLTRDNVGKSLAIVLDNQVLSSPRIESHIAGGSGIITGMKSVEEAQRLALMIRSGALPAPLKILEEKVIGPGLGKDSIQAGTWATVLAVIAVMILMLLCYSWFGIFAIIGLIYNLIFLIASLAFLGATLTLPGIAGIALTMGMAVDANVLINERIKEELALGRRLVMAIDSGYRRAMTSIIDSNATTLIGAIILYFLGSGPVKGFAVTMVLGIIISMVTAVQMNRLLVAFWVYKARPQTIKI